MENRTYEDGFTLVEVLVTLSIIAFLTGITVVNVLPLLQKGRITTIQANIESFEQALKFYQLDNANYPSQQDGLEALVANGQLEKLSLDPWGNPYEYRNPGERGRGGVDIFSLGADGEPGGEGQDADIGNWQ